MPPVAVGIISVVLLWGFIAAYCLTGPVLLVYLLAAAAILLGPILFLAGVRMLYVRLSKLIWCRAETEGHIVDYILSPWKYVAESHAHVRRRYYSRWFPVVEYEADGQRFRQKNKTCILCNERPKEGTALLRYDPKRPKRFYMPDYTNEFSSFGWISTALFLFVGGGFMPFSVMIAASLMAHNWDLGALIQMQ